MNTKKVKDMMIPISEYATVNQDATLYDAVQALEKSQESLPANRQPYRAVLVVNSGGQIVGKIGHLVFLKALEPKYSLVNDMDKLINANLSSDFIDTIKDHYSLWADQAVDVCQKAKSIKAKDCMRPVSESIDENSSIGEAIHKIIMWQSLSILVTKAKEVVGILRLSDLYDEIASYVKESCKTE